MVEWTMGKVATLVIGVAALVLILFFLFKHLGPQGAPAGAVDQMWGKVVPQ